MTTNEPAPAQLNASQPPVHSNDNTRRPDWYDQKLVAHRPFIRKIVRHLAWPQDREDMEQAVFEDACRRWASYDAARYNFATWLGFVARATCQAHRRYKAAEMRDAVEFSADDDCGVCQLLSTPPTQHDAAELSAVLGHLATTKNGAVLVRHAMGAELVEMARERGVSRERVRQVVAQERAMLRKRVG